MVWAEGRPNAAETGRRLVSWDERRGKCGEVWLPKAQGIEGCQADISFLAQCDSYGGTLDSIGRRVGRYVYDLIMCNAREDETANGRSIARAKL
jgi:hypothetical protein